MKILFIENFQYVHATYKYPNIPLGLLSLATILKEKDYDVELINFNYLFLNNIIDYDFDTAKKFDIMAGYIMNKNPDIVGFTALCNTFHNALYLSRLIKERNNNIKIIMGGPHTSLLPETILEDYPWIDLICVGEGEGNIISIIKGMEDNNLTSVPGIVYRNDSSIIRNRDSEMIKDLDTLPLLNYDSILDFKDINFIDIEAGRGCPYKCTYCATNKYWKYNFRLKSVERICKEIMEVKKILGNKKAFFNFIQDNLTTNYDFIMKLCDKLEELHIEWGGNARLDTLDEKLIKRMSETGCTRILMGLESASPAMQKKINKNLNLKNVDTIIELLEKYRITPLISFMYGFPGETEEDLLLTLNMLTSILKKNIYVHLHSLCVLPGSQLFEEYKDKLVERDFYSTVIEASDLEMLNSLERKNRVLFSQFYILEDSLVDKYFLLAGFINQIFIKLYPFLPETFAMLLKEFDNNLLSFYKDFVDNTEKFANFYENNDHMKVVRKNNTLIRNTDLIEHLINFLTEYINNKSLSDFTFKMISHKFCDELEFLSEKTDIKKKGKVYSPWFRRD
ncbi:MAG: radical SAM protein [Candidatus Eremiobacterota bacterium]